MFHDQCFEHQKTSEMNANYIQWRKGVVKGFVVKVLLLPTKYQTSKWKMHANSFTATPPDPYRLQGSMLQQSK